MHDPTTTHHPTRRDFLRTIGLGTAAALLAACQPAPPTPAPTAVPPKPAPTAAPADKAPLSKVEGPAAAPAKPAQDWEKHWNDLLAAAKQEGTLILSGPPTPEVRKELPEAFKKTFGIDMEYLGGRTGELMTRLKAERSAGTYTVDALISGATSLYTQAYPEKMLDPLPPALIHPEVTDGGKWIRGSLWFMDPEQQYILRLANYLSFNVVVNTEHVAAEEIKSLKDLLNPKYKGKISVYEPGISGTGSNTAAYLLKELGEDYVRALYQGQQPGVSRDDRELANWTARGIYPISLAHGANEIETLKKDGFKVAVLKNFPEAPGYVTAGFGLVTLMNKAPHPNAAKLFVNWIAMKEGNELFNRAQVLVSTRKDVDSSWAPDYLIPSPGVNYFDTYSWEFTSQQRSPQELERIKQITGR
jgi:iron(III) transport system substrate-binding protein